jgi:CRP/FNR family transcriptional regulator, cyclic AMP receptor protein
MKQLLPVIESQATKRIVKKRTILLYQGEVPRSAYFLKRGVVKVYSINANGDEQIVAFHNENDVFPDTWIFGAAKSTLYYYEAVTDCQVLTVPRQEIVDAIARDAELLSAAFEHLVHSYTSMLMRITALEQSRAREKLMFTLYYLAFRHGIELKPGVYAVRIGLTHAVIANMVGLTRETTAAELGRLKKMDIIRYNAREYLINRTKLEKLLGEDSFSSLV